MKEILTGLLITAAVSLQAQKPNPPVTKYHTPAETSAWVKDYAAAHPGTVKVHKLAATYGGQPFEVVEIGLETQEQKKTAPAVLVAANLEGTTPLGTEAVLKLLEEIGKDPERYKNLTWYVLPLGNPDGAARLHEKPLRIDGRNLRPWNDDADELTDEDGPDDLNGDGLITQMRYKDPDGTMIPDEKDPRLMKRADPTKGEKGIYKVLTEGIDNDKDGQYNEDGPGGTNIGITFPHLYGYNQPGTGAWSGSESETYSLMQFVAAHPEIAMTMTYGSTNFCLVPMKGGRKSTANLSAIKIPQRYVRMLNADPVKTYTLDEVKEMMKAIVPPGTIVDDAMVAGMLDMGAVVNPIEADLKVFTALSEKYKEFLKGKGFTAKRLDPARDKDGSFELWSYYHLGLPTFSQDFWGLPEPPKTDTAAKSTPRTEPQAKPAEPVKDPVMTAFMAYNDKQLNGKGFVPWTEVPHPEYGKVEVGGVVPYADLLPKAEIIDSLLGIQVPWIFELVKEIPQLDIEETRVEPQGTGIYRVSAWIRNTRRLPFPLAMGTRNKVPPPAIVTVTGKGIHFESGRERTSLEGLGGFEQRKLTWMIRTENPSEVTIRVNPVNARGSEKTINLGGK